MDDAALAVQAARCVFERSIVGLGRQRNSAEVTSGNSRHFSRRSCAGYMNRWCRAKSKSNLLAAAARYKKQAAIQPAEIIQKTSTVLIHFGGVIKIVRKKALG